MRVQCLSVSEVFVLITMEFGTIFSQGYGSPATPIRTSAQISKNFIRNSNGTRCRNQSKGQISLFQHSTKVQVHPYDPDLFLLVGK